jgi:hypothetical protein
VVTLLAVNDMIWRAYGPPIITAWDQTFDGRVALDIRSGSRLADQGEHRAANRFRECQPSCDLYYPNFFKTRSASSAVSTLPTFAISAFAAIRASRFNPLPTAGWAAAAADLFPRRLRL